MSTEFFYSRLRPLEKFLDLANPKNYVNVPNDWYVLITDIAGSTKAIEAGKYKEVNLLGASSIIAVLNVVGRLEIPFIFGGDGASILVPPSVLPQAREALLAIRKLAQESFKMELRVGVVPVETLTAHHPLQIAKFRVTPNYNQASFMGGGLTYATDLVKANPLYQLEVNPDTRKADLSGLECRWQDIPSKHGQTISLIVAAMPSGGKSSEAVYRAVIREIQTIFGDAKNYHPISTAALKLTFNPQKLSAETKARSRSNHGWHRQSYLCKILLENLLGFCFMRFRMKVGDVDWGLYKQDLAAAADYQKIDDILRMVIAGRPAQTERLTRYLEQRFRAGDLTYGMHISDRALMTCLILERRDRHIHLVDGADGGYALAAKSFKARLHRKATNWKTYTKLLKQRDQQK